MPCFILLQLLFFDTEGFESTGKADAYDDRIFALSTLISSVLIYNLPESIRESDVEKLSFAAELAKAFYASSGSSSTTGGSVLGTDTFDDTQSDPPVRPGSMIWLIQRDFLKGSSLDATLKAALRQVPNPHDDQAIMQLNRIRQGLATIASNSTALGLPQPHLDRTRLCEIPDSELDPDYLKKRDELKAAVSASALAKVVRGQPLDGPGLAELISQVVTALNAREIPTAGSLIAYFNKELVDSCREMYVKALERVKIPVESGDLDIAAEAAAAIAKAKFEKEKFGSDVASLREALATALGRELSSRHTANTYESSQVCEAAELECERALEKEAGQKLPSTGRFEARYAKCRATFEAKCVGPARAHNDERLIKAWERETSRFNRDYNDRLYNGLVVISVVAIVAFRFLFKWSFGETAGWAAFIFLQVYPKSFFGTGSSMFDTGGWQTLVSGWEWVVNNPFFDIERLGLVSLVIVGAAVATRRRWWGKVRLCCWRKRGKKSKTHADKDLDV